MHWISRYSKLSLSYYWEKDNEEVDDDENETNFNFTKNQWDTEVLK